MHVSVCDLCLQVCLCVSCMCVCVCVSFVSFCVSMGIYMHVGNCFCLHLCIYVLVLDTKNRTAVFALEILELCSNDACLII